MRRFLELLILTIIVVLAGWLQVGWVRVWPIGGSAFNAVIAVVIAVALFRPWPSALWSAGLAGFFLAQYSVWPWFVYPVALWGMVGALRLLTQRWIATKSSASLIIAVGAATAIFYGLVASQVEAHQVFVQGALGIGWSAIILMTVVQCVVHPILIYAAWRRFTGGSFSSAVATENVQQPF